MMIHPVITTLNRVAVSSVIEKGTSKKMSLTHAYTGKEITRPRIKVSLKNLLSDCTEAAFIVLNFLDLVDSSAKVHLLFCSDKANQLNGAFG